MNADGCGRPQITVTKLHTGKALYCASFYCVLE